VDVITVILQVNSQFHSIVPCCVILLAKLVVLLRCLIMLSPLMLSIYCIF